MSTNPNDVPIPSREQFGLPSTDETQRNQDIPTLAVAAPGVIPTGQLDWIMSTLAKLESRMAAADQQAVTHRFPNRPDPDPPYAVPLSTAVRSTKPHPHPLHTAVPDTQLPPPFPHQPFTTAMHNTIPHYPDITAHNHPPLTGFPSLQHAPSYHPPPWTTSNHFGHYRNYNANFPVGPRPTSCWYPSSDRPPRNHHSHAEYRQLQQEYQPLRPIPPLPQSHRCSAAPLLAAAPPPPPAPMIPPCSSDRIHTLSTMPQCVAAAVPPPPASIFPPCRVMSSALDEEIKTTNLVEVKPGLRVKASQLKQEIKQTENTIFKIGEEGEVLDDDPPPPAAISLPCNHGISPVLVFVLAGPHAVPHDICILAKVLKQDQIWNDHTNFNDIFDADHFILYLKTATSGYYNWTWHFFAFDSGGDTSMLFVAYWFPP